MKILHTADWHLGKRLYGNDLHEDQTFFIKWLLEEIESQKIDYLLISGDIFDLANPSNEARKLYYQTLIAIIQKKCKIIITGGNHDSPSVLNAPKELLHALDITVVGGMPNPLDQMVVPLTNKKGETEAVVAAVPFLRDADLRKHQVGTSHEDRMEAIRSGVKHVFDAMADLASKRYPGLPLIGMGHLFAHGVRTSESEREIQIGNLAGIDATAFSAAYDYIALGHIHQPQSVGTSGKILYSGSPIALSFSEKNDPKRVVVIEIKKGIVFKSHPIPQARRLVKITGDLPTIAGKLEAFDPQEAPLKCFLEIELIETQYDPSKIIALEALLEAFSHPKALVIKHRIQFKDVVHGAHQLFNSDQRLEELQPHEVFKKRLDSEVLDNEKRSLLEAAFSEIVEQLNQGA